MPLRLAQVLHDDYVFPIMGMSMPSNFEGTMSGRTFVLNQPELMLCYRVSSCLLHELWGLLNVIRNWMAITAAYGFMGKYVK